MKPIATLVLVKYWIFLVLSSSGAQDFNIPGTASEIQAKATTFDFCSIPNTYFIVPITYSIVPNTVLAVQPWKERQIQLVTEFATLTGCARFPSSSTTQVSIFHTILEAHLQEADLIHIQVCVSLSTEQESDTAIAPI